jgi:hypothetical protein
MITIMRHYTTSRKVAGSSLDEVTGFFNLPNAAALWPWGRLSLVRETATRNIPGG